MITCNLKGGLGNMMFQIAAIKSMAKDNNADSYFHNVRQHISDLNTISTSPCRGYAQQYYTVFGGLNLGENLQYGYKHSSVVHVPFEATSTTYVSNACYDGFFQCESFFAHNRNYILELFDFSGPIREQARLIHSAIGDGGTTCSIHVRRGDYLKYSNVHPVQDLSYYMQGMEAVGDADRYLVFSDDIEWCKRNFIGSKFAFVSGNLDYIDMAVMSMCDKHVTCNSSFSWWGAWLSNRPGGSIVGPARWFATPEIDSSNILPKSWIKI